jgi:hypothetical protein
MQQSDKKLQTEKVEDSLDPTLLDLLRHQEQIVRPFAWGGTKEKSIIVGVDAEDRLKVISFTKTADGYVIHQSEPFPLPENHDTLIRMSDSLALQDYVTDREFPFKSDIIALENCQVHFVLVQRANERFLAGTSPLTGIDMRVIAEKDNKVFSNELAGLLFFGLRKTLIKDINNDEKLDYVFIGEDTYQHIYLWTVDHDCAVKPLYFEEDGDLMQSVPGRDVFLRRDKSGRGYTIHTRLFVPIIENGKDYWQVTERVYRWDRRESVYKMVEKLSWLKGAD